jgi:hypothetical protein
MENNMATVQVNGSSAVTATSTRNNHGSAINVGNSALLSNQALGRAESSVFGSTVISNATNDYADPALSGGTFAFNNNRPVAMKVTSLLAGSVDNTFLRSGASDLNSRRSIHRQEKVRTTRTSTAIRAGSWNIYTGLWTSTPTTAVDAFYSISAGETSATSTDEAASPSREVPGELTYKLGQKVPVSVDYTAKNS